MSYDFRESPAIGICHLLMEEGANLSIYDPKVKENHIYQYASLLVYIINIFWSHLNRFIHLRSPFLPGSWWVRILLINLKEVTNFYFSITKYQFRLLVTWLISICWDIPVKALLTFATDPYLAAVNSHAIVICTEWDEFVVSSFL